MPEKVCEACGIGFFYKRKEHRTCSRSCGVKIRGGKRRLRERKMLNCDGCGKWMVRALSQLTHRLHVYCSIACRGKYRDIKGSKNPNYQNAGWKVCRGCGSTYHSYTPFRQFCGLTCSQTMARSEALCRVQYGLEAEIKCAQELAQEGWCILKSENSRGPFDLIAFNEGQTRLIQVKRTKAFARRFMRKTIQALQQFNFLGSRHSVELWSLVDSRGWFIKQIA